MLLFLCAVADENQRSKIEYLYERYHDDMMKTAAWILRVSKNRVFDSEDAVQNAFVKIIQYWNEDLWRQMEGDERRIRAYLMAVVTNEAIGFLQKNTDVAGFEDVADQMIDDDDFVERLCIKERYRQVVRQIAELDDRYSVPLQLRYVEDMSPGDIAALLGMPVKTVYTNLNRGKILLLKKLEKEGAQDDDGK